MAQSWACARPDDILAMKRIPVPRVLALVAFCILAACQRSEEAAPPATSPGVSVPAAPAAADPAPAPTVAADEVIGFGGFGPARFGGTEESVRVAWGSEMIRSGSEDACRQLFTRPPAPPPAERGIWFMLVDGKFARYDVDTTKYRAPGGIAVGDPESKVAEVHSGRVESTPHKYVEGAKTLTVTPAEGGDSRLVFETGADGKIARWRIGVPPAVFYVEGCS